MAEEKKDEYTLEAACGYLFACRDQVHLWHFQTASFAEHKALGHLFKQLLEGTDLLIEVWQGHADKKVAGLLPIKTAPYKSVKASSAYLVGVMSWLGGLRTALPYKEAQNIVDDVTGSVARCIYLLTLS